MQKKQNHFAVFLDVDGVLNTETTCKKTPNGYKGIDNARVEILAKIIDKIGGGDIVLSSDWKEMKSTDDDYIYLVDKLALYGLKIAAQTQDITYKCKRGAGIKAYLEEHTEIEEYIILDDNKFDFQDDTKLWDRLLLTNGIEKAQFASETPAVEAILFKDYLKLF